MHCPRPIGPWRLHRHSRLPNAGVVHPRFPSNRPARQPSLHVRQARRPERGLRLRQFPPRAGTHCRLPAYRSERAGRDADRRRQVADLSGPGAGEGRAHRRRLAAGGADARSGRRAEARRGRGGDDQFGGQPRRECRDLAARRFRSGAHSLHGAGTADDRPYDRRPAKDRRVALRHRRGALHLAMGRVLPAGI